MRIWYLGALFMSLPMLALATAFALVALREILPPEASVPAAALLTRDMLLDTCRMIGQATITLIDDSGAQTLPRAAKLALFC